LESTDMSIDTRPRIYQINVSNGGVPKLPIFAAEVTELGISVDSQKHTEIHGGPLRALCLYSLEQHLALQEEGHPIFPGSIGENIVTVGVDLAAMAPGDRLSLGDVEIEITSYTMPCSTIRRAFRDENSNRISQKLHPGWSRLYARVLRPGNIAVGDPIAIVG
jgi:MOSC domain-containing protein YiiM